MTTKPKKILPKSNQEQKPPVTDDLRDPSELIEASVTEEAQESFYYLKTNRGGMFLSHYGKPAGVIEGPENLWFTFNKAEAKKFPAGEAEKVAKRLNANSEGIKITSHDGVGRVWLMPCPLLKLVKV